MIPLVGKWIADHPGTISLGQGIVHYPPPPQVTQAVLYASAEDFRVHRYGPVQGIEDLLTLISSKLTEENHVELESRRRLVVTAGSNMGFLNGLCAIADVDDEIILLSPCYFNHEMAVQLVNCRPVMVSTNGAYQLDIPAIEGAISERTRAIVTVSPNNPTGAVYSRRDLTYINELCRQRGIYHIHDEAYEYFVYGGEAHFSPASLPTSIEHTISLYSLSKAYGMAGWRVGYMVVPEHLDLEIKKVQDTNLVCPPILSQIAGAAALRAGGGWCHEQIAGFPQVRDLVMDELSTLGEACHVPRPEGAFYALAQIDSPLPDIRLVERLIQEFGVAVIPGSTFGIQDRCVLRIAYGALARQTVAEGMGRLVRGLKALVTTHAP